MVREHLSIFGTIKEISLNKNKRGKFVGSCFLNMATPKEAERVLTAAGTLIEGRPLVVEFAKNQNPATKEINIPTSCDDSEKTSGRLENNSKKYHQLKVKPPPGTQWKTNVIFVANLPYNLDNLEQNLYDIFFQMWTYFRSTAYL